MATSEQARVEQRLEGETLTLGAVGAWLTATTPDSLLLETLDPQGARRAVLDISATQGLDSFGALCLTRIGQRLEAAGLEVTLQGGDEDWRRLIETVAERAGELPTPPKGEPPFLGFFLRVGEATFDIGKRALALVNFLGHAVIVITQNLIVPTRLRWVALVNQMEQTGFNAIPIVGLISFLIGVVMAYQGADQLSRFGAQIFTVNLVGFGVLREMGILLTAIIVAGRSGSAFTAQIGTMQVNEEIDALKTIGLDPMVVLVVPRVLAMMITLPLLTFYADIMGLLGGAVMAAVVLDISFVQFFTQLRDAVGLWDLGVGLIKAPVFAFIIAVVGCFEGFQVSRNAESVGKRTTAAVVEGVFLVIVLDAMLSIFFTVVGV